ncbi:flagellar hook capping FlgD N-terminal domain-containing protein [Texcoconibacillus texcoconensis]|uniref:Flagellar basal-body rod modification protein FlgD n=1 Tax=Texcoconibacillus texcoconensis TaxID=1095777 RepID=A0A840QL34_9BACI|nr:flagellar hook capping FlgD N-terminal domain-containing protein [Texcoconibacillus texcoconensis]MBB5172073.1 flagellar basal-body rod modification protein FlgD [Texcoconibacillus texcoconensis]
MDVLGAAQTPMQQQQQAMLEEQQRKQKDPLSLQGKQNQDLVRDPEEDDMDRDAFLKLLITQLQNQNPLDPMDDTEFVSQMANFSSLEQMTNINENLESFLEQQNQEQFVSHSDMIGKEISWQAEVADGNGETTTETRTDIVQAVSFKDGETKLVVSANEKVSADEIKQVTLPHEE